MVGVEETTGAALFLPSGGMLEALPMPLGSLSTRGLAGPNGTPLIGESPAPADPAGGRELRVCASQRNQEQDEAQRDHPGC